MPNLIDIPTIVNALVSFYALGDTSAAPDIAKGVLTKVSIGGCQTSCRLKI